MATWNSQAVDCLGRWLGLSSVQQRALEALAGEIHGVSHDVETNVQAICDKFQGIARTTRDQASSVLDLVSSTRLVEIDGETMTLAQLATKVGDTLSEVLGKLIQLSSRSVSMVYSLDDVIAELKLV